MINTNFLFSSTKLENSSGDIWRVLDCTSNQVWILGSTKGFEGSTLFAFPESCFDWILWLTLLFNLFLIKSIVSIFVGWEIELEFKFKLKSEEPGGGGGGGGRKSFVEGAGGGGGGGGGGAPYEIFSSWISEIFSSLIEFSDSVFIFGSKVSLTFSSKFMSVESIFTIVSSAVCLIIFPLIFDEIFDPRLEWVIGVGIRILKSICSRYLKCGLLWISVLISVPKSIRLGSFSRWFLKKNEMMKLKK